MEEGERQDGRDTGRERLSGFAEQLASCLLKETISEAGTGEQEWSIPCSRECHSHKHERVSTSSSGRVRGSGQLCWTPESSGSLDNTMEGRQGGNNTCRVEKVGDEDTICEEGQGIGACNDRRISDNCQIEGDGDDSANAIQRLSFDVSESRSTESEDVALRKGLSVPDVGSDDIHDRVSFGSETSKSQKLGFLRHLGLKKPKQDGASDPSGRRRMKSLRKTLSSLFHLRNKLDAETSDGSLEAKPRRPTSAPSIFRLPTRKPKNVPPCQRALPPVPGITISNSPGSSGNVFGDSGENSSSQAADSNELSLMNPAPQLDTDVDNIDFAASIEKVKDHGWYWGPLSGEAAERILSGEPDGSFVVRDSSDHHYIFSLTFKLNGFVRHVRIEHDQGNFSFGSFTKFKSNTIVDFIENAVEHSRSGRYLFFLHRRPVLGPMRVQLLHPVSRFKRVQSLQHLCRYIIVKHVRKDHLDQLPVPSRIKTYLNTSFYYSEQVAEEEESTDAVDIEQIGVNSEHWGRVPEEESEDLTNMEEQSDRAQFDLSLEASNTSSDNRTNLQ